MEWLSDQWKDASARVILDLGFFRRCASSTMRTVQGRLSRSDTERRAVSNDVTTAITDNAVMRKGYCQRFQEVGLTNVQPTQSEIVQNLLSFALGTDVRANFEVAPLHASVSIYIHIREFSSRLTLSNSLVHTFTTELGVTINAVGHLSSGGGNFRLSCHSLLSWSCETRFLLRSLSEGRPDLRMIADRNEMTWIVFPRPMSSPSMTPRPRI